MLLGTVAMGLVMVATGASANAHQCCEPVPAPTCCEPVCCPPPPVKVEFCAVDPVTCCKYPVTVCVPACCANELPCYAGCRSGFLGRKILTYKWPGCGHCVEVVITKFGRVIVRD